MKLEKHTYRGRCGVTLCHTPDATGSFESKITCCLRFRTMTWMLHATPADCVKTAAHPLHPNRLTEAHIELTHHCVLDPDQSEARFLWQNESQHTAAADLSERHPLFLCLWTPIFGCVGSSQPLQSFIAVCLRSPSGHIFPIVMLYLHQAILLRSKGRLFFGVVVNVCWLSRIAAACNFEGFLRLIKGTAGAVSSGVTLQSVTQCCSHLLWSCHSHQGWIHQV